MANFMHVLNAICGVAGGRDFLYTEFIEPKYDCFRYTYGFDGFGNIVSQSPRRFTERSGGEPERFERIAFKAVADFNEKGNRHVLPDLTMPEQTRLASLCAEIGAAACSTGRRRFRSCRKHMECLMRAIQRRLIHDQESEY